MITRRRTLGFFAVVALLVIVVGWRRRAGGEEDDVRPEVAVHVDRIRRATLRRTVTAYGTVEPAPPLGGGPAAGAMITPFVDGVVSSVEVIEGRHVNRGQVLVRLDSRMAQVAVARARAQAEVADSAFRRQASLLGSDATSQRAYLDARARREAARADLAEAETALAYLNISAPLAGTVVRVGAAVGQHVDATTVLAQVVDLSRLVVTAGVPAREIGGVAVGQRALLGEGDSVPEGEVVVLSGDVDPASGTYRVQASVPPEAGFTPGQFTEIHIVAEEHPNVLAVPEASVVTRPGAGTWIMVVEGDRAVRRPMTVGLRDRGLTEVSGDGVEEGVRIVTDEAYGLPEGTKVRVVGG